MHYTPDETHVTTEVYRHDNGWNIHHLFDIETLMETLQEVKKVERHFLTSLVWLESSVEGQMSYLQRLRPASLLSDAH